ncbi:hypothetical protein ACFQU7_06025 [Pseudoroseomonas wenyumeiae]
MSHDAQTAAAGVTTVLDALCLGDLGFDAQRTETFLDGVRISMPWHRPGC